MQEVLGDLRKFLKKLELSNYEINCYIALLSSNALTAKEISSMSKVPTGRIYGVLEQLTKFGLAEIQDSWPKKYKAIAPNSALRNLITRVEENNQKNVQALYTQARELEKQIRAVDAFGHEQDTQFFWSTAYGIQAILTLYRERIRELGTEFLFTGFINEETLKVLPQAKYLYGGLGHFLREHSQSQVKFLWSFDLDERNPSTSKKEENERVFSLLSGIMREKLQLSTDLSGFEMKYVDQRISTYFDIFDDRRVILKLRNPVQPSQVFSCISVLDPNLAQELKTYFTQIWSSNAVS